MQILEVQFFVELLYQRNVTFYSLSKTSMMQQAFTDNKQY